MVKLNKISEKEVEKLAIQGMKSYKHEFFEVARELYENNYTERAIRAIKNKERLPDSIGKVVNYNNMDIDTILLVANYLSEKDKVLRNVKSKIN